MGSTNIPPSLSAVFKNSFAYKTVKDRLPVILTKVIDTTHRHKHEIIALHGLEGGDDLKNVIHRLSELRYRLSTDKPLTMFESKKSDATIYNSYLKNLEEKTGEEPSWYKSTWLDIECYFYRKVYEAFEISRYLCDWDPFRYQKEQAYVEALEPITVLAEHLITLIEKAQNMPIDTKRANVENLLQISLWGNKCDLSLSVGEQIIHSTSPLKQVDALKEFILANNLQLVLERLFKNLRTNGVKNGQMDIVLDNAGLELFSDLCLAEFLLTIGLCDRVIFHVKSLPWFVSDTMCSDFTWAIEMLSGSSVKSLRTLGTKWQQRLDENTFQVKPHQFWTLPHAYCFMPQAAPDLWNHFNTENLLSIFKGDLNYRKLVGDLDWPTTTPFEVSVREFRPKTPFVTLRTLKADVVTGLKDGLAEKIQEKASNWMISGDYAVIQYCEPVKK